MRYKTIEMKLKRVVRHKPYVIDEPSVTLVAELSAEDMKKFKEVTDEMREDLHILMEEEVQLCKEEFKKEVGDA